MQYTSQQFQDALTGSVEPVFTADAYYAGEMLENGLPIIGGQVSLDSASTVRGACSLMVNDPDGLFVPKLRSDPLAPYGQEINIRAGLNIGGAPETVSLGWYRIQQATPKESWKWVGKAAQFVASGSSVPVEGLDRGSKVADYPFITPEQPVKKMVWAEIVRLVAGLVPVADPGFDASIPTGSVVYASDRWEAITTLAKLCSAHPVITPDGTLTLKRDAPGSSVWELSAGPEGTIGAFSPTLTRSGLYNAVNIQGVDADGNPITVILTQEQGPLRWGGPFGCVPAPQIVDPLLRTLAQVKARATTELAKAIVGQSQSLDIPTVLNYALELEDIITVNLPDRHGPVPVTKLVMPMRGTMTTTVALPDEWLIRG